MKETQKQAANWQKATFRKSPPSLLSRQLRKKRTRHLNRRRQIIGLAYSAAGCMGLIGLFQMGMLKHLPDPPLPYFDADTVDASEEAYEKMATPDAFIGLTSYAATAMLAAMGGPYRTTEKPWLPLTLAGKTIFDAYQAAKLSRDQWVRHRAFCFWCLVAAGATFAAVPLALGEARETARELLLGNG